MSTTVEEMERFWEKLKADNEGKPFWFHPASSSFYRAIEMARQGKRFYRGKPHKRKSLARQSRAIRMKKKHDAFVNGTYWYMVEAYDALGRMYNTEGCEEA
jgi:hypothetical protein